MDQDSTKLKKLTCFQRIYHFFRSQWHVLLALLVLVELGIYVRSQNIIWGPRIIPLSGDDFYHLFLWSGAKGLLWGDFDYETLFEPLSKVFTFSYKDGHPPLRNILINCILRLTNDPANARLVALIPGIILIPLSFSFGHFISKGAPKQDRVLIGLSFASVITLTEQLIILSFETRPYMLLLVSSLVAIICVIHFIETQSTKALLAFFVFSCLSLLSNYSGTIIIAISCILLIFFTIKNYKLLSKKSLGLILIIMLAISSLTLFQIRELRKNDSITRYTKNSQELNSYFAQYYIKEPLDFPKRVFSFFHFFSTKEASQARVNEAIAQIFLLAYLLGLIVLVKRKSYNLLLLSLIPIIFALAAAKAQIYPLGPTRHCVYLLPSVLISWSYCFQSLLSSKSTILRIVFKLLLSAILVFFFFTSFNASKHQSLQILGTFGYTFIDDEDLIEVLEKMDNAKKSNKLLVLDKATNDLIKQKMILMWFKHQRQDKDIPFPKSILSNKDFCNSEILGQKNIKLCKELRSGQNSNYKSILAISFDFKEPRDQEKFNAHPKLVQTLIDKTPYRKRISYDNDSLSRWSFTELSK